MATWVLQLTLPFKIVVTLSARVKVYGRTIVFVTLKVSYSPKCQETRGIHSIVPCEAYFGIVMVIGKGKVHLIMTPLYEKNSSQKRSGMARVVKRSHSFTCHLRVYSREKWSVPARLPSRRFTHLLIGEGRKAEFRRGSSVWQMDGQTGRIALPARIKIIDSMVDCCRNGSGKRSSVNARLHDARDISSLSEAVDVIADVVCTVCAPSSDPGACDTGDVKVQRCVTYLIDKLRRSRRRRGNRYLTSDWVKWYSEKPKAYSRRLYQSDEWWASVCACCVSSLCDFVTKYNTQNTSDHSYCS